ncbi:hypothetical protein GCM10009612_40120 [Streptomyces beijiangensis]
MPVLSGGLEVRRTRYSFAIRSPAPGLGGGRFGGLSGTDSQVFVVCVDPNSEVKILLPVCAGEPGIIASIQAVERAESIMPGLEPMADVSLPCACADRGVA